MVVEPIEQEEVTAGGIVLPETAKESHSRQSLSVGPGDRDDKGNRIAMDVKEGDKVLFAKYAGTEFKLDGKKLLIRARVTCSPLSKANDIQSIIRSTWIWQLKLVF